MVSRSRDGPGGRAAPRVVVTSYDLSSVRAMARGAGDEVLAHYRRAEAVTMKADRSPLTAADKAAHEFILRALRVMPDRLPVISEEGDIPGYDVRRTWPRYWLVDPLDGTKEFIQQNGEFTVNIALIENGEPVLGVVFAPAIDVEYYAARGTGSWKSEKGGVPVRLFGPGKPGADGAVVVESRSHPSKELEEYLKTIKVKQRVPSGSSLKFGVVAEGKAHVYPRFGPTHDWDVAAGDCVWRNAIAEGQRPSPIVYNTPELLNPGFVIGVPA